MVYHVMRDGSVKTDLKGYIVKEKDVPTLYQVIEEISKKKDKRLQDVKQND